MSLVILDNLAIKGALVTQLDPTKSPTGKELRKFKVKGVLNGEEDYNTYKTLGEYANVSIDTPVSYFRAKLDTTYIAVLDLIDNYSADIKIEFEITEKDLAIPENHDFDSSIFELAVETRLRIRALTSLLISKGVIEEQEFVDIYRKLLQEEEQSNELINRVLYGIEHNPVPEKAGE